MTILTFLDPAAMPNQTMDQATFDSLWAQVLAKLPVWGAEANATAASMKALAAGGAYALPYIFDSATTDADPGAGKLRLSSATQSSATVMRLDLTAGGQDYATLIDTFDASTSGVKGSIRLVKLGDLSKWMTFDVTARAAPSGYRNLSVTCTDSSSASPFSNSDPLMLFFQRSGDKGTPDTYMHVSDRKASGTTGGTPTAAAYNTRTLNTVDTNTIASASLTSDTVTLPAGDYEFRARAPGCNGKHKVFLYNTTDSAYVAGGSSMEAQSSGLTGDSVVSGRFSIAGSKSFQLRHYFASSAADALGRAVSVPSQTELYSEIEFWKRG